VFILPRGVLFERDGVSSSASICDERRGWECDMAGKDARGLRGERRCGAGEEEEEGGEFSFRLHQV
jgi:hypothetical protein